MFLGSKAETTNGSRMADGEPFFCFKNGSVETLLRKISSCDYWSQKVKDDTPTDSSCLVGLREFKMMKENLLHSCMRSVSVSIYTTLFVL